MVLDKLVLQALGHATYHTHNQAPRTLAAQRCEILQARHYLLLGIIAYAACIEQYGVGIGHIVGKGIAGHLHHRGHHLAVGHIHLAAVSFYV